MALKPPSPRLTPALAQSFVRAMELEFARRILPRVEAACESSTLRRYLAYFETTDGKVVIGVPHYWAAYYNDGHGAFGPSRTKYLVWFRDPLKDDPRLNGQWPIRYDEWRPLTKQEFRNAIDVNIAQGGPPLTGPYAVIVKYARAQDGKHFFERGFENFLAEEGASVGAAKFSRFVKLFAPTERDTLRVPRHKIVGVGR